jgi:hypothetical protein
MQVKAKLDKEEPRHDKERKGNERAGEIGGKAMQDNGRGKASQAKAR